MPGPEPAEAMEREVNQPEREVIDQKEQKTGAEGICSCGIVDRADSQSEDQQVAGGNPNGEVECPAAEEWQGECCEGLESFKSAKQDKRNYGEGAEELLEVHGGCSRRL